MDQNNLLPYATAAAWMYSNTATYATAAAQQHGHDGGAYMPSGHDTQYAATAYAGQPYSGRDAAAAYPDPTYGGSGGGYDGYDAYGGEYDGYNAYYQGTPGYAYHDASYSATMASYSVDTGAGAAMPYGRAQGASGAARGATAGIASARQQPQAAGGSAAPAVRTSSTAGSVAASMSSTFTGRVKENALFKRPAIEALACSAPVWLVYYNYTAAGPTGDHGLLSPEQLIAQYTAGRLQAHTLVAGFTEDARALVRSGAAAQKTGPGVAAGGARSDVGAVPASFLRPVVTLLAMARAQLPYSPVSREQLAAGMPAPGWCLPGSLFQPAAAAALGGGSSGISSGGSGGRGPLRNWEPAAIDAAVRELLGTARHWCFLNNYSDSGRWSCSQNLSVAHMLQRLGPGSKCLHACVLGTLEPLPDRQWIPTSMVLPLGALLQALDSHPGLAYTPPRAADVVFFIEDAVRAVQGRPEAEARLDAFRAARALRATMDAATQQQQQQQRAAAAASAAAAAAAAQARLDPGAKAFVPPAGAGQPHASGNGVAAQGASGAGAGTSGAVGDTAPTAGPSTAGVQASSTHAAREGGPAGSAASPAAGGTEARTGTAAASSSAPEQAGSAAGAARGSKDPPPQAADQNQQKASTSAAPAAALARQKANNPQPKPQPRQQQEVHESGQSGPRGRNSPAGTAPHAAAPSPTPQATQSYAQAAAAAAAAAVAAARAQQGQMPSGGAPPGFGPHGGPHHRGAGVEAHAGPSRGMLPGMAAPVAMPSPMVAGDMDGARRGAPPIPVPVPVSQQSAPNSGGMEMHAYAGQQQQEQEQGASEGSVLNPISTPFIRFETSVFRLFQGDHGQHAFSSLWWYLHPADTAAARPGRPPPRVLGPYSCEQMILAYIAQLMPPHALVCGTQGTLAPPSPPPPVAFRPLQQLLDDVEEGRGYALLQIAPVLQAQQQNLQGVGAQAAIPAMLAAAAAAQQQQQAARPLR